MEYYLHGIVPYRRAFLTLAYISCLALIIPCFVLEHGQVNNFYLNRHLKYNTPLP